MDWPNVQARCDKQSSKSFSSNALTLKLVKALGFLVLEKHWARGGDVIMKPLQKQWQNSYLPETKQIIHQSKGFDVRELSKNILFIEFEPMSQK